MLQEDYGPEITQRMAVLSCLKWIFNEENSEWVDHHPLPEEPEEEVSFNKYLILDLNVLRAPKTNLLYG